MDKTQVLALLDARGISYELAEHEAVFHMGALAEAGVPHLDRIAKNLLLRDDKKRAFFLVSVWGEKRLDLKAFRKAHGTRPLTFASDDDLQRHAAGTLERCAGKRALVHRRGFFQRRGHHRRASERQHRHDFSCRRGSCGSSAQ